MNSPTDDRNGESDPVLTRLSHVRSHPLPDIGTQGRPSSGDLAQTRASVAMVTRNSNETTAGMKRKTSVAVAGLKYTQRPSIAAKAGRKPSVAIGAGASKRSSVAAYREGRKDLLSNARKVSQQGVGSGRKPSRAVVAAGS